MNIQELLEMGKRLIPVNEEQKEVDYVKAQVQQLQDSFNNLEKLFNEGYTWEEMKQDPDLYNDIIYSEAGIHQAAYDIQKYIHTKFNQMGIPAQYLGVSYDDAEARNFEANGLETGEAE